MNRYPLIEEISLTLSPPDIFGLFHHEPHSSFLDSGMDPQRLGRYSFIGIDPFLVMRSRGNAITIMGEDKQKVERGNPFDVLGRLLEIYRLDSFPAPVPFLGGAIGYFSYDLCHFIECLPTNAIDDLKLPESYFAFYDTIIAFDNLKNKTYIVSTGFPELGQTQRLKRARLRFAELKRRLYAANTTALGNNFKNINGSTEALLKSNFTPDDYVKAIERAREYIIAGDIYQVNLSQRFETDLTISPYQLYQRLRQINPAPFASYLNFEGITVVGASPERFLKVDGDSIETRPIKGMVTT